MMSSNKEQILRLPALPDRPDDAHKGTFGTVLVIGGAPTMLGAPALCASAALTSGAGLVKIVSQREVMQAAIIIEPSATGIILPTAAAAAWAALNKADPKGEAVLAVGPGAGQEGVLKQLLPRLLAGERPMVLDADGLNLLAKSKKRVNENQSGAPCVLTPHPGEFARLAQPLGITYSPTDPKQRVDAAMALAKAHSAVVVLKGNRTVVADGRSLRGKSMRYYINNTGNAALATAGSGDVLTGMIAALIAQKMDLLDAAVLAVHLHGRAAELWAKDNGLSGLRARDLAMMVPKAFHALRGPARKKSASPRRNKPGRDD